MTSVNGAKLSTVTLDRYVPTARPSLQLIFELHCQIHANKQAERETERLSQDLFLVIIEREHNKQQTTY